MVLTAGRGTSGGTSNWASGFLPSNYQGVRFRNQGDPVLNLAAPDGFRMNVSAGVLIRSASSTKNTTPRLENPEILARIASYELAFRMQSAAPELIDLSDETEKTLEMYGVNRSEEGWQAGPGYRKGVFNTFSRNCLLARRLVERGVRFVNLYHASWDHHSDLDSELAFNCQMADQPVAALLKDLKQRGLLDETLVIWGAEFGRTPLGENRVGRKPNTGRDHHPFAFTIFMAGGGDQGRTGDRQDRRDRMEYRGRSDPHQ